MLAQLDHVLSQKFLPEIKLIAGNKEVKVKFTMHIKQ